MVLEGNLGHAPEVRFTASGQAVVNLRVASNRFYKDKDGKSQKRTTWARCVVWGTRAEAVGKYLHSGSKVRITGELCNGTYVNKEQVTVRYDEIRVSDIRFLDQAPKSGSNPPEDVLPESQEETPPSLPAEVDPRDVVF